MLPRRLVTFALWVLLLAGPVMATPLRGFHHTAWMPKDGAPVDIWSIAQAGNGELWLGTGAGLFRFDGMRFQRHVVPGGARLASNNITALHFADDGALWIGYHSAGASRLDARGITHFESGAEFPSGMVFRFEEDAGGTLWAAVDEGLARMEGGHWQRVGADWGFPGKHAQWLLRDRKGTLWVAAGDTVLRLPAGARRFEATGVVSARYSVLAEDLQGQVWVSDGLSGTRPVLPVPGQAPLPLVAKRFLFDRDGALWATDGEQGGLALLRPGSGRPQRLRQREGLTADMAVPLLQDREGNLWVGTNIGLNRIRPNDVVPVHDLPDTVHGNFAAFIGADGAARLVNGGMLLRSTRSGVEAEANGLPEVWAAQPDGRGGAWLLGRQGLWHWSTENRLRDAALPPGRRASEISAFTADGEGGLWIALASAGVFRGGHQGWQHEAAADGELPTVLAGDGRGGVWLGYDGYEVAHLEQGRLRRFDAGSGLNVGRITSIHVGERVLVAGEEGIAESDGERFRSLRPDLASLFGGITGIVRTGDGDLWFNGSAGLLRISTDEWRRALDQPTRVPEVRVFNQQDGLPGVALQARPAPTLVMDGAGVLWASTNQGMAWIDPKAIRRNRLAPPVSIATITAQGRDYPALAALMLPEGTSQLRIDYSAASLTVPERVRFRYRLLGADEAWQDAGTRRQAFYTNLGPGDYRFQVMAANNDGVWNTEGAELSFKITPTFLQSRGFVVACVAVGMLLLWLLHRLRLRRASERIRDRLVERHQERERIARDLHDTLLQGFQGLMLRFQAVAATLPATPERERLDHALDRAEQVLGEGRDRVSGLRADALGDESLAEALAAVGLDYARDEGRQFLTRVEGLLRPLDPVAQDELYLMGREALVNAFRHSGAARIEVLLRYESDELQLQVSDDGRGLDQGVVSAGNREGHWGLPGMRERAARIGAQIEIQGGPGTGTQILLRLPAPLAYRGRRRPSFLRDLWRGREPKG